MGKFKSPDGAFWIDDEMLRLDKHNRLAFNLDSLTALSHYVETLVFYKFDFSDWHGWKSQLSIGSMIDNIEMGIPCVARITDMPEVAGIAGEYDDKEVTPYIELKDCTYYKDEFEYENSNFDPNRDESRTFVEFSGIFHYANHNYAATLRCQGCRQSDLFELTINQLSN